MKNEEKVVVSGFKGSGLYPFKPKAVDYDILNKSKTSQQTIDRPDAINTNDSDNVQEKQFLQIVEKRLPEDTLSDFKEAAISGSWTDDLEKKALFDYWFDIYKKSTGSILKQKPVIKKIENLNERNIQNTLQNNLNTDQRYASDDIDSTIDSSINNVCTSDQEYSTNIQAIDLVNSEEAVQSIIIFENDLNTMNCEKTTFIENEQIYELLYESIQISNEEPLSNTNKILQSTFTDINQNNFIGQTISLNNRNPDLLSQNDTNKTQLTINNFTSEQNHQIELLKENPKNVCKIIDGHDSNNENISFITADKDDSRKTPFKEIFTLPVEYLPKKKRSKVEKSGKSKLVPCIYLPSVGTSDAWYSLQLEKENLKKKKAEKQKNKQKLQEEKKKLMDQVKELQKKIKEEK